MGSSKSCLICYDLNLDKIPKHRNTCSSDGRWLNWMASSDLRSSATHKRVHGSDKRKRKSREKGCETCGLLKDAVDTLIRCGLTATQLESKAALDAGDPELEYEIAVAERDDGEDDAEDNRSDDLSDGDSNDGEKEGRRKDTKMKMKNESTSLRLVLRCELPVEVGERQESHSREEFEVELYTLPGCPASPWPAISTAGEVPTKLDGEQSAQIIKSWLRNCDEAHKLCQEKTSTGKGNMLPKRVLQIDKDKIRLVETKGVTGKYIALSHCWGKEQILITTRETLDKRMANIELEELPQTFRDAVEVTRSLGLLYLWIDSLCIIQGDPLDWEEQSAVMADIYAMCYLNIAATRSSSGKEGFLGPRWTSRDTLTQTMWREERTPPQIRTLEVKSFPVPTRENSLDHGIRIRLSLNSSHETVQTGRWIRQHIRTAPLLQRAWVHQEWTLSPRTVHFHANEMIWYCEVEQLCECKTLDTKTLGGDGWSASKDRIANLGRLEKKEDLHGLWRTIVEDYVLLDLTYESDRLPAISGLASRFSQYLPEGDGYLAGLWKSDLARDLLWDCGSAGTGGPTRKKVPGPVLAPSWSWASIHWGGEDSGMSWEKESKPKLAKWAETVTYEQDSRIRIYSAECETTVTNPFGSVSDGTIHMEAVLCAIVTGPEDEEEEEGIETSDDGTLSDEVEEIETSDDPALSDGGVSDSGISSTKHSDTSGRSTRSLANGDEIPHISPIPEPEPEPEMKRVIKEAEGSPSGSTATGTATTNHSRSFTNLLSSVVTKSHKIFNSLHLDYDTKAEHLANTSVESTIYCLFIGAFSANFDNDSNPHTSLRGLILRPSTRVADTFERIGCFTQYIEDWTTGTEVFTKEAAVAEIKLV
ncbi:hypothetical protein LAWI1_G004505 [Lachnellula willkommii]|uniref:Heterokaryon incompatibility domain-containing protein n=1 Tax=Lachnellula willkommii TaxID=215461 RepID=A0A559MBU9_9HELO|nr:hypothetical protein LAWI1_G004505 [Lachnellula willkommii]